VPKLANLCTNFSSKKPVKNVNAPQGRQELLSHWGVLELDHPSKQLL
jgi:hypothetical protein